MARIVRSILSLMVALAALAAISLSVTPPAVLASGPIPGTLFGVTCSCDGGQLLSFPSGNPAAGRIIGTLTGFVEPNEEVNSLAFRALDGALWMISSTNRLYTVNTTTAALTFRFGPFDLGSQTLNYLSFDPVSGVIRIITGEDGNFRVHPATGALTRDTNLQFGCGCGYQGLANSFPFSGAASTTVYSVDEGNARLVSIGGVGGTPSPGTGTIIAVAPLGIPPTDTLIAAILSMTGGQHNTLYALLYGVGDFLTFEPTLYTIDLVNGAVVKIGPIGGLQENDSVMAFAALPASGLRMTTPTRTVDETVGVIQVGIERTGSTVDTVSVSYATANGSAVAGVNYVAASGTRVLQPGERSVTVPIQILDDGFVATPKSFALNLTAVGPAGAIVSPASTTITITDNRPAPTMQFSASAYAFNESSGLAVIQVTRTGVVGSASIAYSVSGGTAVPGVDFSPVSGRVSFSSTVSQGPITIPLLYNPASQGVRTIILTLSDPAGGVTGTPVSTTVSIIDDGAPPALQFSAPAVGVNRAAGSVSVIVQRTGATTGSASVAYATADGTGQAGIDYSATSGTLSFTPGQLTRAITVPLLGPSPRGDRTFSLTLSAPSGAALGTPIESVVTIIDASSPPTIALEAAAVSVPEQAGFVELRIIRSGNLNLPARVAYATADGTAAAGVDYLATSGVADFAKGAATVIVRVQFIVDSIGEPAKSFSLNLSDPEFGAVVGVPATTIITIVDSLAPPTFGFTTTAFSVPQTGPVAVIAITRLGSTTGAVSVGYSTADGTGRAGIDYVATSGVASFGPGVTIQTFLVPIVNAGPHPARTVNLALSSPSSGGLIGAPGTAILSVIPLGVQYPVIFRDHRGGW